MAIPYKEIAKAALMNWNGLSEEEANIKIQTESVKELEEQIYAMGSVKYAVAGIAQQVGLSNDEMETFFKVVVNGPENHEIFDIITTKMKGFTEQQTLNVLSTIHDGWITDNSSEKTLNKKVARNQLRQYAPIELIGWNEAQSDLLFLGPILDSVGIKIDIQKLSETYNANVIKYIEKNNLNNKSNLIDLLKKGKDYYPALTENVEIFLTEGNYHDVMADQIIQNLYKNMGVDSPITLDSKSL